MNRAEASNKPITPQTIEGFQKALNFQNWPLREQFVPGFSAKTALKSAAEEYRLERETLAHVVGPWVDRNYIYSNAESRSAFVLTVTIGQKSARDAAQGLLLQLFYRERYSEPRVNSSAPPFGDVTIYLHGDSKQAVAFVRNNVGISVENYSSGRKPVDAERLASAIDQALQQSSTVPVLAGHSAVPIIRRFEPRSSVVHPGERTDLIIEVVDKYPPLQYQFRAENGSYNLEPGQNDRWYFRAGPIKGQAEVTLRIVNDINLMAESRFSIGME